MTCGDPLVQQGPARVSWLGRKKSRTLKSPLAVFVFGLLDSRPPRGRASGMSLNRLSILAAAEP